MSDAKFRPSITEVKTQIVKDLNLAGISFELEENLPESYNDLLKQVSSLVESIYRFDSLKLKQWFYNIDIPEKMLVDIYSKIDFHSDLADLIIRRTELKIITRHHYSNKDDGKKLL